MRYRVAGGIAHVGTDMVLKLSEEQAKARAFALEEVPGGLRPTQVVQFKIGEEFEIVGVEHDQLPRPLAMVLTSLGAADPDPKAKSGRKSAKDGRAEDGGRD